MTFVLAAASWFIVYIAALLFHLASAGRIYEASRLKLGFPEMLGKILPLSLILAVVCFMLIYGALALLWRNRAFRASAMETAERYFYIGTQDWHGSLTLYGVFTVALAIISALLTSFPWHAATAVLVAVAALIMAARHEFISIETSSVRDVTGRSAKVAYAVRCSVYTVDDVGICWSAVGEPTLDDSHISGGRGQGTFAATIENLTPGARYRVRAWARIGGSMQPDYGNEAAFATIPVVITGSAGEIGNDRAEIKATVQSETSPILERGFCWRISTDELSAEQQITAGSGPGEYEGAIKSLSPGSTYRIRAFAKYGQGVVFGDVVEITTLQDKTKGPQA